MAIKKVSLINAGRNGDVKSDRNRSYAVVFQVLVDSAYDGIGTVGSAAGADWSIPLIWSQYIGYENGYSDVWALCVKIDPQPTSDWKKWIVTCTFETNYQQQKQDDPSQDNVLPWVEIETSRETVTRLFDGTPITNAVGQVVDGIEDDVKSITLCFLRNELAINPLIGTYNGAYNSDPFYFMMPYQGRMDIGLDKPLRRNEYVYWPHTYKIKFKYGINGNGWAINPANRGTLLWGSDGTLVKPINPNTNEPIDGDVNLNSKGTALSNSPTYLSGIIESDGSQMYPTTLPSVTPSGYLLIRQPQVFETLSLGGAWTEFD